LFCFDFATLGGEPGASLSHTPQSFLPFILFLR
jgi:hypothetical protein